MKIEKISDNQIRCILTKEDLESRHIRLSELAYGTDKARILFQEMMHFANDQYGFEADRYPLMVEAIPMSSDAIVIIVTKVEYPDELDSRFAQFSDTQDDDTLAMGEETSFGYSSEHKNTSIYRADANDVLNQYHAPSHPKKEIYRGFMFQNLESVIATAPLLTSVTQTRNSLYKGTDSAYYLILYMDDLSPKQFNKMCNILTEYSLPVDVHKKSISYLKEHGKLILQENALEQLAQL